ncbi:MAG: hypothetical protein IPL84_06370 [Chitinophagaceae bacterium]|nr:hypothetical protein [Chitinophagaceae bacterium]
MKGEELLEQDHDDIEKKFNCPSGEIVLCLFYLTRKIELINNKEHQSGYILYMSQDNFCLDKHKHKVYFSFYKKNIKTLTEVQLFFFSWL